MRIFLIENLLKFLSAGNLYDYFSNGWNFFDLILIFCHYFMYYWNVLTNSNFYIYFGIFRLIRILKNIQINEFQILFKFVLRSFNLLGELIIIFLIFIFVFSNMGVLLFKYSLKNQCLFEELGIFPIEIKNFCGNFKCPDKYICSKNLKNPDNGETSFDTFYYAVMQTLRIITCDNWSNLMNSIQRVDSSWFFLYFAFLAFVGNYILNTFALAVIKVKFNEIWRNKQINTVKNQTSLIDFRKFLIKNNKFCFYRKRKIVNLKEKYEVKNLSVKKRGFIFKSLTFGKKKNNISKVFKTLSNNFKSIISQKNRFVKKIKKNPHSEIENTIDFKKNQNFYFFQYLKLNQLIKFCLSILKDKKSELQPLDIIINHEIPYESLSTDDVLGLKLIEKIKIL